MTGKHEVTREDAVRRRLYWASGVVAALVTAIMVGKFLHGDTKDAPVWYDVGRRVLSGDTLVGLRSYRYPPTFAVLIAPLCLLPFVWFFFAWHAINAALFAVAVRQAALLTVPSGHPPKLRAYWLPAALTLVYAVDNLFLAQTNILITALLYATFLRLAQKREWHAGIPLGAAIAIKVFPAPLLAYLLYRGKLRAFAASILACLFFLLVLPAPFRGAGRNLREVQQWGNRVVEPYLSRGKAGDWGQHALDFGNQSLPAVARRYLTRVDANVAARQGTPIYVNLMDLNEAQVNTVVLALAAGLAVLFIWGCGLRRPTSGAQQAAEYALCVLLLLLVSAISWTYFFVALLLPIAAADRLHSPELGLRRSTVRALWSGMFIFGLVTVLLRVFYLRALGSLFFATLWLCIALAMACRDLRRPCRRDA